MRTGDTGAFTIIYKHYYKSLFGWIYHILKDRDSCEDILHDIFLQFWKRREEVSITDSLSSYLYTAARNQVFNTIRKRKVREALFENLELRIWGEPDPENLLYQKELNSQLSEIINNLPEKSREVYLLSREEQLSYAEIATRLSISVKTVEYHISTALKRIRTSFDKLLPLLMILFK